MSEKNYEKHYQRIYKMLVDSGDYDDWRDFEKYPEHRDDVLDTDTRIILDVPRLNPEFF